MSILPEPGSFRDKDGFIFYKNENIYRAIHFSYKDTWELLNTAPFFTELIKENKLIGYKEEQDNFGLKEVYKTLNVQKIPFISYPSEWNFVQLKKAALLTLAIQKKALANNFSLKDASAYNVQFIGSLPVFIDTLSFYKYKDGEPWQAYKQFCRHFLGPLLLWHYGYSEMKSLFINDIDGIPLSVSAKLLPFRSKFNLLAYTHIHLHSKFERKYSAEEKINTRNLNVSKAKSLAIIEHLEQGIKNLKIKKPATNWTDYYETFSYSNEGYAIKKTFAEKCFLKIKGKLCVDLGANTGEFSQLASAHFDYVVACDSDVEVVNIIQAKKTANILPLHIHLENPTPAFGWNNKERKAFMERIKGADLTMALALIHHLCIGNNVPLTKLAEFFAGISHFLLIEFVPKTDVQVKKILVTKKDIFTDYNIENFKICFGSYFQIIDQQMIPGSDREIFLMKRIS